jgi:hypothetical protein
MKLMDDLEKRILEMRILKVNQENRILEQERNRKEAEKERFREEQNRIAAEEDRKHYDRFPGIWKGMDPERQSELKREAADSLPGFLICSI